MSDSLGITGFIEIFQGKLDKMKLQLKKELEKSKHERDRKWIKRQLSSARKLNQRLKEMRNSVVKRCPHCGEKL